MNKPVVGYQPGAMALRPPRRRAKRPPVDDCNHHARDALAYLRPGAWAEAPHLDYAAHRNAAYDPEVARQQSAAMQDAAAHGEPTPWPVRMGYTSDEPWSPWPATFVFIGIGCSVLAFGLYAYKHWITG